MRAIAPGVRLVSVRTPTLPPATHTNAWVLGRGRLTVVDPASPWDDERARLAAELRSLHDAGEAVERIFLTHHHVDHVSGAEDLRARLSTPDHRIPIAAHPVTAELVRDRIEVDELWEDGGVYEAGGLELRALHTPGHAPGHLVLHDPASGAMIAGDMVAGIGTILISPVDGDLGQYLDSLERMKAVGASTLLPAHGEPLAHPEALLSFYVAHRHQRTEQIRQALDRLGASTPAELAPVVYPELPTTAHPIAAAQILSHLRWMVAHGVAEHHGTGFVRC